MRMLHVMLTTGLTLALLMTTPTFAKEPAWVSLFNGESLEGWVNVNGAPETWTVGDGVIRCTGTPVAALRTPKMYENFVFEVEWRHLKPGGNAGIFVWSSAIAARGVPFLTAIEVQVLDNGFNIPGKNEWYTTHGDVFPIHGSTMKPMHRRNGQRCFPLEERSHSSPEWNHYRIEAKDGSVRLAVNGKIVAGGDDCSFRKGYLGLESEGSPTEWRNLRIQELPGGKATTEQSAMADEGWQTMYNGVDLRGWTVSRPEADHWKPADWRLTAAKAGEDVLWSEAPPGDFEVLVDVHAQDAVAGPPQLVLGQGAASVRVNLPAAPDVWTRYLLVRRAKAASVHIVANPGEVVTTVPVAARELLGAEPVRVGLSGGPGSFANIYTRRLMAE